MDSFLSLLIAALITVILFVIGKKVFPYFFKKKDLEFINAVSAYLSLIGGGAFLSIAAPAFNSFKALLVWVIAGAVILGLEGRRFSERKKILVQLLLCFGAVLAFPDLSFSLDMIWKLPGLVLLFGGCWYFFVWFNQFPSVSYVNILSWTLGLLGVGLLIRTVPSFIMAPILFSGIISFILMRLNLSRGLLSFSRKEALLFGFLWSSIFTYFISTGAIVQTFCFWGYYLFEGVILGWAFIFHRPLKTFLSHLIEHPKCASKAVGFVFSHMLILSFFGAMTLQLKGASSGIVVFELIIIAIVLIDLFMRLNNLEHPSPTCREIFADFKKAVMSSTAQLKETFLLKKESLPKNISKKSKITAKKKTSRKRRLKK